MLTLALLWLLRRLDVRGRRTGLGHDAMAWAVVWGATALGLYPEAGNWKLETGNWKLEAGN